MMATLILSLMGLALLIVTLAFTMITGHQAAIRNPKEYYYSPREESKEGAQMLLISFENHWFNMIDVGDILQEHREICPYPELSLRWRYPTLPQKVYLSQYKETLQEVDFDHWVNQTIPAFAANAQECYCNSDYPRQGHTCQGHLATGSLSEFVNNFYLLERPERGPDFREAANTSFEKALEALEFSLMETQSRNTGAQLQNFEVWQSKIVRSFKREKKRFLARANERETMLLPAGRCLNMRHPEISVFLSRYIFLVSDKSRGNFFLVCEQLYIRQCVHALHTSKYP
jgi:hypothetical protein